jgi:hypothetical protein
MQLVRVHALSLSVSLGFAIGFAGCGGGGGSDGSCQPGERLCECVNGECLGDLVCFEGVCLSGNAETSGDGDGDGDTNASGDGDGDGDTNGDGDGDGDPNCMVEQYLANYEPPAVMLVVDASGSMVGNLWDHDANINTPTVTRWNSLYTAVQSIMTNFGDKLRAGIQRFPGAAATGAYNESACTTQPTPEAQIAADNGIAILAAIPPANANSMAIKGGTPTTRGIQSAVTHLLAQPGDPSRAIVLITDGAANCDINLPLPDLLESYDETLPLVVADAYQIHGIPVFVVGIDILNLVLGIGNDGSPEANPFERLNDVAVAGGTAKNGAEKFYNSSDQVELLTSLQGIFTSLVDCTIDLSELPDGLPPPENIPFVEFEFGGNPIPHVDDCLNDDGWTWVEEGAVAQLCGSACNQFAADADPATVVYGCG